MLHYDAVENLEVTFDDHAHLTAGAQASFARTLLLVAGKSPNEIGLTGANEQEIHKQATNPRLLIPDMNKQQFDALCDEGERVISGFKKQVQETTGIELHTPRIRYCADGHKPVVTFIAKSLPKKFDPSIAQYEISRPDVYDGKVVLDYHPLLAEGKPKYHCFDIHKGDDIHILESLLDRLHKIFPAPERRIASMNNGSLQR